jgi:hypothetical protein
MKEGKSTTEFWLSIVVIGMTLVLFHYADYPAVVFLGMCLVVSTYIYGRKIVKQSYITNSNIGGDYTGQNKYDIADITDSDGVSIGQDSGVDINGKA